MERGWIKPNVEISPACPRCGSSNTKFCYYNNYSLTQPRYFCKGCRRYWTKGGSLRNVPIGGGCRKSRRGKSIRTDGGPSNNSRNILAHNGIESSTSPIPGPHPDNVSSASIDLAAVYANFLNQTTPRPDNRVEPSVFENPDRFSVPPVGFPNLHMSNLSSHYLPQESGFFEPQLLGFGNLGFFGELDQQIVTGNGFSSISNAMENINAILPPLPGEDNNIVVNASDGVLWPGTDVILQNQMLTAPMNTVELPAARSQINSEMLNGNIVSPFSPLINLEAIFRS